MRNAEFGIRNSECKPRGALHSALRIPNSELAAVRGLKASSAAHGFEPIAESAGQVERILITSGSGPTHAKASLSDGPAAGVEGITVHRALADRMAALLTMAARARAGTRLG